MRNFVRSVPGKILIVLQNRLYTFATTSLPRDSFPVPLAFESEQSLFVLDTKQPNRLTYKTRGGKAPLRYFLKAQIEGLEIDSATGTVTVDTSKLLPGATELLVQQLGNSGGYAPPGAAPSTLEGRVTAFAKPYLERVKDLSMPAGTIPVACTITVSASDSEQQTSSLEHQVIIPVPQSGIIKFINDKNATQDTQRRAAQAQMEEQRRAAQAAQSGRSTPASPELQRRVQELERQVQDLEAQNRLLKELLARPAGTQPR